MSLARCKVYLLPATLTAAERKAKHLRVSLDQYVERLIVADTQTAKATKEKVVTP